MALTLISGRYYPQLLWHPLLKPSIENALGNSIEAGEGLRHAQHLWALEGLSPGFYNAVDPTIAKPDRLMMVKDAEKLSMEDLERCKASLLNEEIEDDLDEQPAHAMEVDPFA